MWKDLIVEEIRKYREKYAQRFNYDLHTICQDIRRKQGKDGRRVVSLNPRPVVLSLTDDIQPSKR